MSAYQRGSPDLISFLVGSEHSPAKSTQDVFLMILLAHKLILDAPSCEVGTSVNQTRMITKLLLCRTFPLTCAKNLQNHSPAETELGPTLHRSNGILSMPCGKTWIDKNKVQNYTNSRFQPRSTSYVCISIMLIRTCIFPNSMSGTSQPNGEDYFSGPSPYTNTRSPAAVSMTGSLGE